MYQVVGKVVSSNKIIGFMVYDFNNHNLFKATSKDYIRKSKSISNIVIIDNKLSVTDGSFKKLPVYNFNGVPSKNNLPVVLERVTNNGDIVGYTLITKEGYKKYKTSDLLKKYREFYNAKVVTKDGSTFLSAKRGTFKEFKLDTPQMSIKSSFNKNEFEIEYKDNAIVLKKYKGANLNVVIPNGVTEIGDYAFFQCCNLKSVVIPNSVTKIGDYAFIHRWELTSVVIPNSVTTIGKGAFEDCRGLTSVTIPNSTTTIGESAFENCTGLTSVTIPDSVRRIDYFAFKNCIGLRSVTISNSVRTIDVAVFENCTGLTSVTIPNSVTRICVSAFKNCTGLTSVTIPNSVTEIGKDAFKNCTGLISITIPNSVTEIDESAFENCTRLASVTIPDSVMRIGKSAFENCTGLKTKTANYKAFNLVNNQIKCVDYIFKENEWSDEIENIELCEQGYHFCTNLFENFNYYFGVLDKDIVIYECEVGDKVVKSEISKCATNKIKPVRRLFKSDIINILNGQGAEK